MSIRSLESYRERVRRIEDDPRFVAEEVKLAFADDLVRLLEARGLKRTELAEKLKTNRGYVTRILDTEYNLTIETMARIAHALDARISLHMHPKDSDVRWVEETSQVVQRSRISPSPHPSPVQGRGGVGQRQEDDAYDLPSKREVPIVADKPRRGKR